MQRAKAVSDAYAAAFPSVACMVQLVVVFGAFVSSARLPMYPSFW